MAHVLCIVGCVEPSESFAAESPNTWHPLWSDCPESCVKVAANCNVCSASNREASVSLHSPDRKFAVYQHGLANTNNILLSNTFIRLCELGIPYDSFYVEPRLNSMLRTIVTVFNLSLKLLLPTLRVQPCHSVWGLGCQDPEHPARNMRNNKPQ